MKIIDSIARFTFTLLPLMLITLVIYASVLHAPNMLIDNPFAISIFTLVVISAVIMLVLLIIIMRTVFYTNIDFDLSSKNSYDKVFKGFLLKLSNQENINMNIIITDIKNVLFKYEHAIFSNSKLSLNDRPSEKDLEKTLIHILYVELQNAIDNDSDAFTLTVKQDDISYHDINFKIIQDISKPYTITITLTLC